MAHGPSKTVICTKCWHQHETHSGGSAAEQESVLSRQDTRKNWKPGLPQVDSLGSRDLGTDTGRSIQEFDLPLSTSRPPFADPYCQAPQGLAILGRAVYLNVSECI